MGRLNTTSLVIAEQTLLRLAIENHDYLYKLERDVFISETAKQLYDAILQLQQHHTSLSVSNIAGELGVDENNIQSFLEKDIPTNMDFEYWRDKLAIEKSKQNIQEAIINGILPESSGKENSEFDLDKVDAFITTVQTNLEKSKGKKIVLYSASQLLSTYDDVIAQRASGVYYYDTGCYHLNSALTEGFAPGKITTLFGSSGIGKSSYALYLVNRQINKQIPCLYISLEMDKISTMDRLIAQRNRLPIEQLIPNSMVRFDETEYMNDYIESILEREQRRLGKATRFYFIEEPGLSLHDVEYYINYVKRLIGMKYITVTIDLLTMIKEFSRGENKASTYEDGLNALHELAKRTNAHIIGVVQSRRPQSKVKVETVKDVEKLKPQIEEIKNSSAFEERSRIILSAFRKRFIIERFLPDAPELDFMSDIMEVQILKQNMGGLPLRYYVYDAKAAHLSPYIMGDDETDPYGIQ